jgi:SNF2 family DNA or RNA helicase
VAPEIAVGSAKIKAFMELAAELIANRHKALVFSQFVDYLSLLRAELDAAGTHRIGQERPVTVYRRVIKGSIEERIMQLHEEKRALAEGLSTGEEFSGAWSVEELLQLLRGQ